MIIKSKLLSQVPMLVHGFSTKPMGNMSYRRDFDGQADANNRRFLQQLDIDPSVSVIINPELRHGSTVAFVEPAPAHLGYREVNIDSPEAVRYLNGEARYADAPDAAIGIDACFSYHNECFITIRPADCAVVYVYDLIEDVYGLIHVGVAGLFSSIVSRSFEALQSWQNCDPRNFVCFVSPSISPAKYRLEQSGTYKRHLHSLLTPEEVQHFNLQARLRQQLLSCGVLPENLEINELCTGTQEELFFSNHRCKTQEARNREGRMLALIGKK